LATGTLATIQHSLQKLAYIDTFDRLQVRIRAIQNQSWLGSVQIQQRLWGPFATALISQNIQQLADYNRLTPFQTILECGGRHLGMMNIHDRQQVGAIN
jgi:hypothetical protein